MFASILALALVGQIAADGFTINPAIPPDLVTWRWTQHDGKAALGWGRLNDAGLFVAVQPAPEVPCYPASKPKLNAPDDKPAWRLARYADELCLAWGTIDGSGRIVTSRPRPELPLLPANAYDNPYTRVEVLSKPMPPGGSASASIGGLPNYATNGVVAEKIDGQGLTLRASDEATAEHARNVLYESTAGDPAGRIKLPKLAPKIAPYAVAFGLFGVAGVIFVARSLQSR